MIQSALSGRTASAATYEDAVRALNNLQSNAAYINAVKNNQLMRQKNNQNNHQDVIKYLIRSGLSMDQVDSLSVIHVAGTKGKGSTCAFTESILREHGFRTGFFSSPHLISVRERFRIDGQPISEPEFSRYFWHVYNLLYQKKDGDDDMPQYFKFLTVLMFHIFLKANIDVAILEVGIGGEKDCTNIVNSTVCTGITSLGLDHTSLLGDTLECIAFHKAGIFKPKAPAFTVPQPSEAMSVLQKRAVEKNCPLTIVPSIEAYPWPKSVPVLGIKSKVQKENASLAIQLASTWMARRGRRKNYIINKEPPLKNSALCFDKVASALESCKWPGRTQVLSGRTIDFYVDGAHTIESITCCVSWFKHVTRNVSKHASRYLIFNATGNRDSSQLLEPLRELGFEKAFFVPNIAGQIYTIDQENFNSPVLEQLENCQIHADIWGENSVLANNVYEALLLIREDNEYNFSSNEFRKPQVLVTGSLHLVGSLLSIIDPELTMSTNF